MINPFCRGYCIHCISNVNWKYTLSTKCTYQRLLVRAAIQGHFPISIQFFLPLLEIGYIVKCIVLNWRSHFLCLGFISINGDFIYFHPPVNSIKNIFGTTFISCFGERFDMQWSHNYYCNSSRSSSLISHHDTQDGTVWVSQIEHFYTICLHKWKKKKKKNILSNFSLFMPHDQYLMKMWPCVKKICLSQGGGGWDVPLRVWKWPIFNPNFAKI